MSKSSPRQIIELLGIYKMVPSPAMLRRQAAISSEESPAKKLAQAKRELAAVVLVEVLAHHTKRSFKGKFGQPGKGSNSFDWNQRQLSLDGAAQVRYDPAGKEIVRLAFFIHAFDPKKPIRSESGDLTPTPILPMPARLAKVLPYEVCD